MASNKAIVSGISGRYALALFELALESKELETTESDLLQLSALYNESADLRDLILSPVYSRDDVASGINAVAAKAKLSKRVQNFLGVLVENGRLNVLVNVIRDFGLLMADHRGELKAEVISAAALTKTQINEIKKKLKSAVGQNVEVDASVDENLLGGLIVKVGSRMIDSSIKTKLDNLAIAMKGVQ